MATIRKFASAAVGLSLLAAIVVTSSAAQAGPAPAVVLSGSVGNLHAGSALVVVQVGLPWGAKKPRYIPAGFHYPAVAAQTITSRSFSIGVPDSATLQRAAKLGHGIVEFNVLVLSGSRFTSMMYPYTLTAAAAHGNRRALAQVRSQSATLGRFRAFAPDPAARRRAMLSAQRRGAADPPGCTSLAYGNPDEDLTRIGEIHVGKTNGLSMRWTYYSTSDTTLTVGLSTSGDTGPWSADGSFTTSNSLGSGSGFTAGNPTLIYVDGDEWYQRYLWKYCSWLYTTQVTSAVADSVEGVNSPPRNPYGGCAPGDSPYGYAQISPDKGYFDSDRGTAQGYGTDATVWGFNFGGQTGFTDSIHHHYDYNNPGGGISAVCGGGGGMMPDSKILYSSTY